MNRLFLALCVAAAASCSTAAHAQNTGHQGTGNQGDGNGNTTLTLINGDTFTNPGAMFQDLRTRTDYAAGNPKAVVDAYPWVFDNVGDLIQQKREATPTGP